MTVTTTWFDEEESILLHNFENGWTNKEYLEAIETRRQIIDNLDQTVHVILDMSISGITPTNLFTGVMHAMRRRHPRQGIVVVVSDSAMIEILGNVVRQNDMRVVETLLHAHTIEEALEIIRSKT